MAEEVKNKPDVVRADVLDVLRQIRNGNLVYEMSRELEKLVEAVRDTRKGGELTLKIRVKPLKAGSDALDVDADVAAKAPNPPRPVSIFYPTADNTLSRVDPRQMRLPGVDGE